MMALAPEDSHGPAAPSPKEAAAERREGIGLLISALLADELRGKSGGKGCKADSKGKAWPSGASKNSHSDALVEGSEWPKGADRTRKKVSDFTKTEKKLILCTFERRAKGTAIRSQSATPVTKSRVPDDHKRETETTHEASLRATL